MCLCRDGGVVMARYVHEGRRHLDAIHLKNTVPKGGGGLLCLEKGTNCGLISLAK